jgi:putative membrane protein
MATLVDKYFSEADLGAIEAAIKTAELSTAGEIAVEITSRSRNWALEQLLHAVAISVVCGAVALYINRVDEWGVYYNFSQAVLWSGIGFVIGYFGWGWCLRRRSRRQKTVWLRALDQFRSLRPVRNMAGVLLFVSLEENEAAIVADQGIASKVSDNCWPTLRLRLVDNLRNARHAEGIIETIATVGAEMAHHFPREDDDKNELPDRPSIVD